MQSAQQNIKVQWLVAATGVLLFAIKAVAWWLTGSVAILSDALESTVNVTAAFIGLFSLYVSAKPRDREHPYGHGKVEFISAGIEGTLITLAGVVIFVEAIRRLQTHQPIANLDEGIGLVLFSAVVNFAMGTLAVRIGKRNNSLALVASGRHLQSDTWTTAGIILGLLLLRLTNWFWIDSAVAMFFAVFILFTGYRIVRSSIAGVMDEADRELLHELVEFLESRRRENWIDIHNLRVIKYGAVLHLDFHLTVPWYLDVKTAHEELHTIESELRNAFGESVEAFIHTDPCRPSACPICSKQDCPVRQAPFSHRIRWTVDNISSNERHSLKTISRYSSGDSG